MISSTDPASATRGNARAASTYTGSRIENSTSHCRDHRGTFAVVVPLSTVMSRSIAETEYSVGRPFTKTLFAAVSWRGSRRNAIPVTSTAPMMGRYSRMRRLG